MSDSIFYYLDEHEVVPTNDVILWAEARKHNHIVAQTHIGNLFVSTVFVGLWNDIFETIVFQTGKWHDEYQERYETWDEAEAGHERICRSILALVPDTCPFPE